MIYARFEIAADMQVGIEDNRSKSKTASLDGHASHDGVGIASFGNLAALSLLPLSRNQELSAQQQG